MQTTTSNFDTAEASNMRKLTHRVFISFDKTFDAAIDFFTLDSSNLDGTDILLGTNNVVQEWDKYTYTEYSNRVINVEWQREQETPWSLTLGMADILFNNTDDFFTTGSGSAIDGDIKPRRPVKIFAGFGGNVVPVFVGLTEGAPVIDENEKTARFHCVDFLSFVFNNQLDETALFTDQRVDQIISSLLQGAGLSSTQMDLDTAFTTIPYCFFNKGDKLGDALNELVEAELGRLYMDENGMIKFDNRQNFNESSVKTYDKSNTLGFRTKQYDQLFNVVEVKSEILDVQENQKVYDLSQAFIVSAGASVEFWADFQDPVTSIDSPSYTATPTDTASEYTANLAEDGSGSAYSDISLSASSLFSKSYKMTFENTGASNAYVTLVRLFGTPVKAVSEIYERQEVSASVTDFEERPMTIENRFIQTDTAARSLAIFISTIHADLGGVSELDVKANPALQLNDTITSNVTDDSGDYYVSKSTNKMVGDGYDQTLQVQRRLTLDIFVLDSSNLDGSEVLGP